MECFLIGALLLFLLLHSLASNKKNNVFGIRFWPWALKGIVVLTVSMTVRVVVNKVLMVAYQMESLSIHGVNDYNTVFGDLFTEAGALGMLFKRLYMRYFVNAVAYLPIAFLVAAWIIIFAWSIYFWIRKRDFWIVVCLPAMLVIPLIMSIIAGAAERYHSAQYIPLVIMVGFLLLAICIKYHMTKYGTIILTVIAVCGIFAQVCEMNKWFVQDYQKFLEAKKIMVDVADELEADYDTKKPVVIVGPELPSDEVCQGLFVSMDSWKYKIITIMTSFDPTIKEKYHYQTREGDWYYTYTESPMLSVLTWASNPFENCDLAASQQYINFWDMIGYHDFTYVSDEEVILEARELRKTLKLPGYPEEGYIHEWNGILVINLSEVED